jgi:hypothetical protein
MGIGITCKKMKIWYTVSGFSIGHLRRGATVKFVSATVKKSPPQFRQIFAVILIT